MTIPVAFRLSRRSWAEPATAIVVPSRQPSGLVAACSSLGCDPTGRVFDLAGGFLVELERPTTERMPGSLRLRALAAALYVPVDAELVPALLDDEARGLVRDWGLVFLPGGRALYFDRHAPVELSELFSAQPRPRRAWSCLPEPRRLADRLVQIALELPEPSAETLYSSFKPQRRGAGARAGADEQSDPSRLDEARLVVGGRPSDAEGTKDAPAGHPITSLAEGALHGIYTTVRALEGMFSQAGQMLTGLKEKAQWDWVDHSALLGKLVQEFRAGDPERALRRAIPISPVNDSTRIAPAGGLPWNRPIYCLADLLRRPRRGERTPVLHAQPGVVQLLAQEYHRAAQRACEQGDFRRAAYIYGVLLRDDRLAASALELGGLHHDAAILYLQKVQDKAAAAEAFEAAGAVDRAITLYRQLGRHEAVGDLLRRIGEDEAAVVEYELAARQLTCSSPPDYLAAGRLLLEKARQPSSAIHEFQTGWGRRPQGNAALCALELARLHAQRGAMGPIRTLLDQADELFDSAGQPYDGFFYNEVTRLAMLPALAAHALELRDRTLQTLVRKLRGGVAGCQSPPALVSALLGRSKLWPAALVSDAEFAASAESKRTRGRASAAKNDARIAGVQIGRGIVTALCHTETASELFLGFDSGSVVAYRPDRDRVVKVADDIGPVTSLAVDPDGTTVVVLHKSHNKTVMSCLRKHPDGSFRGRPETHILATQDGWLTPVLPWSFERLVGCFDGHDLLIVDAASGVLWQRRRIAANGSSPPVTALLLPTGGPNRPPDSRLVVLTHDGPRWIGLDSAGKLLYRTALQWQPAVPVASTLRSVPISWRFVPPCYEILGLDKNGAVFAAQFHAGERALELSAAQVATTQGGYLAAARMGTTSVIAVSPQRIDWLDGSTGRLHVVQKLDLGFPTAVACFAYPSTQETVVVCSDGFIARVAAPRRSTSPRLSRISNHEPAE